MLLKCDIFLQDNTSASKLYLMKHTFFWQKLLLRSSTHFGTGCVSFTGKKLPVDNFT